jgi:SPP1 family predicted phage head-tail adaptor
MDRSDVINLISVSREKDENGFWVESKTSRQVYCRVDSISQSEFFEAGRNGLNPDYRFTMFSGDYQNEEIVEYKGQTYSIYRTYLTRTDNIELYVQRKGGTNGISTD